MKIDLKEKLKEELGVDAVMSEVARPACDASHDGVTSVTDRSNMAKPSDPGIGSPMHDRYRQLVVNAPDAILVVSNGKVLFANPAAAALVGVPDAATLIGRDVLEFAASGSRAEILDPVQQLHLKDRSASLVETTALRADGTTRDVELMTCPTIWEGIAASIVFVRDVTARKRIERDLHASEDRYRQVVDSMNEALIVHDGQGNVKFVNQQFYAQFGCEPSEVIGRSAAEIFAPETAELVQRGIARRRQGLHDRYEAVLAGKSGKTVLAQISAAPLLDDGVFTGSLALITDITDRERVQQKLLRSEQRFQELVDNSPNFIFSFDCDNRYTAVNKACRDALGLEEDAILGRTLKEVGLPPDVAREWSEQIVRTRATRLTQTVETVVSFRGSAPRVMRRITSPMYGDGGELIGVTGLSIDITDQKATEERTEKLLRAVEQMDEVMFTTDPLGVITYVNPAFEKLYGYTREEAIGQTPRMIKSYEMPADTYRQFWADLTAGQTVRMEFVNRRKDGQLIRMVSSVSPIHSEDGRLTGFTAVQRDVTAERRAQEERLQFEEQLARTDKMQALGTLAGGIAHDFNNILSIVLTHTTIAAFSTNNPPRLKSAIETIKRAVQRGAGLSRQILTFARETTVDFKAVQPDGVVHEIGSMIAEMFPRNIRIDVVQEGEIPSITADADQLHQAVLNLCLNARDAMSNGGTLALRIQRVSRDKLSKPFGAPLDCDHVCIAVSDTGHGMSKETAARIFEPFFTTKEVGKGTGLGLAVVYGIMKEHLGWIDVSSEPDRGTTMLLYFPANVTAASEEQVQEAQQLERGNETVLIIEDEEQIAQGLAIQLVESGYSVKVARDAIEAGNCIRSAALPFDVIVTDLGLPGISSRDLVALLRRIVPDVPLIPMTGYVDADLHHDVVAAGTQPILQKPFSVDQLERSIREAVKRRAKDNT